MLNYIWAGLIAFSLVFALSSDIRDYVHEPAHAAATTAPAGIEAGVAEHFVKLQAITAAATDFAQKAVEISIGLIGVLSLWLGLMRIGEKSGLIDILVKVIQPVLRPLFPEIPKDHPALGMIALNLSANMLGLGNAATPFGIKAMEELQTLNPSSDTATNPMVMLLALNTACVQFMPPATLVALMGVQTSRIYFPIVTVTAGCAIIAIIVTKLLGRLWVYRRTDPNRV